jgi:poly-gamma-glutamate capsule biosynthesis protein CapA/YwtB (metallophosphatase superfamily)
VAFAPHSGCLDLNDINQAVALVKKTKTKCDILFVSFHGGAEGSGATHVTRKTEIFYGQNRGNVYDFAHQMIDAGADIVVGHGPHVARAMELYHSKLIAYSLGNFCTYGMFNLRGVSGYAPLLQFKVNEKGNFVNGKIISFKQINEGGPIKDENYSAAQLIKKLSREDFPDNQLVIDEDGGISIKQ